MLREDRQALRPYIAVGVIRSGDASVTALWIELKKIDRSRNSATLEGAEHPQT